MKFAFLRLLPFILICVLCGDSSAHRMTPKSAGNSVDESFIYKAINGPRSLADKDRGVIEFLKRSDKSQVERSSGKNVTTSEVSILETVNNEPITSTDVINIAKLMFFFSGKSYNKEIATMMIPAIISSLEDDRLRQQCAGMFGIKVTANDVNQEISKIASANGLTVQALEKKLAASEINMEIFKQSIRSRLIFQLISRSLADEGKVSKSEIEEARREFQTLLNSKRYYVLEIFRYDRQSAEKIHQLTHQGFDFPMLAENFSQTVQAGKRGAKWLTEKSIEPEVLLHLKKMSPGDVSEVIKTKSGYKIVQLISTAEPGMADSSESTYKFLIASVLFKSSLYTQKDMQEIGNMLEEFLKVDGAQSFKEFCKLKNIEFEEVDMPHPDPYYMELISKSKNSGKVSALQAIDAPEKVNVVLYISEIPAIAKLPGDDALKEYASEKKIDDSFIRNFKRLKSMSHIEKYPENIKRISQ